MMLYAVLALLLLGVLLWWLHRRRPPPPPAAAAAPAAPPSDAADGLVIDPAADEDRLHPRPRAPEQTAEACWVPPGRAATVHGYTIVRGMVYVGAGLYRDRAAWKPEDCLIDPTLLVAPDAPDHAGRTVPLWPASAKLNPNARAAFLAFVAAGADDPDAHPGYVMLYLQGLERRLRKDAPPAAEAEALREEIRRLRALYGRHPVVARAAAALLDDGGGGAGDVA